MINKGTSVVECYHPSDDGVWCELYINWIHYNTPSTYDDPGDEDMHITSYTMTSYCDEPVQNMSIPHWIDWEDVLNQIDTNDYTEPEY